MNLTSILESKMSCQLKTEKYANLSTSTNHELYLSADTLVGPRGGKYLIMNTTAFI